MTAPNDKYICTRPEFWIYKNTISGNDKKNFETENAKERRIKDWEEG